MNVTPAYTQKFKNEEDQLAEKTALEKILDKSFSRHDARLLFNFFTTHAGREIIADKEIGFTGAEKREFLLTAYEERILVPLKSVKGPAWEDKLVDFSDGGIYFVPSVVWPVIEILNQENRICINRIIKKTIPELSIEDITSVSQLLDTIIIHSPHFIFEVGLLKLFYDQIGFIQGLHDIIDLFVIRGMMSPCPRKSLITGLSWYEIHPVLFWTTP